MQIETEVLAAMKNKLKKNQEREEQLPALVQQLRIDLEKLKKPRQNPNGSFEAKTRI